MDLKSLLLTRLVNVLDPKAVAGLAPSDARQQLRPVVECLLEEENPILNQVEWELTIDQVLADAFGFGALEAIGWYDFVQEVRVEGPDSILVRHGESAEPAGITFRSLEQLYLITSRLLGEEGKPAELAPGSFERETPVNFLLTAHIPSTRQEPPILHFRRLRTTGPSPADIPPPRLPRRELQVFVRFVQACYAAGIDDLPQSEEARLRPLAEQAAEEFLASEKQNTPEERERIVALLLNEARQ